VLQAECEELLQRIGTAGDSHAAAGEAMGVALNGEGSGTSLEDRLEVAKTRATQIASEVSSCKPPELSYLPKPAIPSFNRVCPGT
jgi:hypothetical protein